MKFSLLKMKSRGQWGTMEKNKFDQNMLKISLFNLFALTIIIYKY